MQTCAQKYSGETKIHFLLSISVHAARLNEGSPAHTYVGEVAAVYGA
jgi:hypothetical protein